jgi:hypothetical protein
MKKSVQMIILSFILIMVISWSCENFVVYPETPEIQFKSLLIEDSLDLENPNNSKKKFLLTFSIIDGDGDVGIYYKNGSIFPGFEDFGNRDLFVTLYEKQSGDFIARQLYDYAIPYIELEGQDKSIKADIEIKISIPFGIYNYDTVKYSLYMYDRAKHLSNTIESPVFHADTTGLIKP